MNYEALAKDALSQKRFHHSVKVAEMCVKLARHYNEDENKAYLAGILHDIRKEAEKTENEALVKSSGYEVDSIEQSNPFLWHGIAAAAYMKQKLNITDEDVLNAVRFHTVARPGMSKLEKIVYLGDLVSEDRRYPDVERYREYTFDDLDNAMYEALKFSIEEVMRKGVKLNRFTFQAYNYYHDRRK